MAFEFCETFINGLFVVSPIICGDDRGYFFEAYSEKDFSAERLNLKFVQDNQSMSSKGVLRGLHFQKKHPQGKLVRCLNGSLFDVAVDLRRGSETFGKYFGIVLDSQKKNMLYIPKGFAHGFLSLTDDCVLSYKCSDFYHPEDEDGILWNDPLIGIDWKSVMPDVLKKALLSEKDSKLGAFDPEKNYFDINGKWSGK